jgi:GT2 family glycosyltransferase
VAAAVHGDALRSLESVSGRPSVAVVVPFLGTRADGEALVEAIGHLRTDSGDRIVVADNTGAGVAVAPAGSGIEVVPVPLERSSYYARNAGAEAVEAEWLLFLDSDCRPAASLLDDYFEGEIDAGCGIVAGGVVGAPAQEGLAARYARSRGQIEEGFHLDTGPHPSGVTANLLVRRAAWEGVGGFQEGVRSGADLEFCWRVQDAGWGFLHRPSARVEHLHPERIRGMTRKARRHAAGRAWVNRRYPGALPRPRLLAPLARAGAGSAAWLVRGEPERALFKLIDLAWAGSMLGGYLAGDNRAVRPLADARAQANRAVFVADSFPERGQPSAASPPASLVEARARAWAPDRALIRRSSICFAEDDGPLVRLRSLGWLLLRHPLSAARDLMRRRAGAAGRPEGLAALAPAARRVASRGASRLVAAPDPRSGDRAARLARLLGLELEHTAVRG